MVKFKIFGRKKGRKYPVKWDENGISARQRCFEMLENKTPFAEIAEVTGLKINSVYKYSRQYVKNPTLESQSDFLKRIFDKSAPNRGQDIEIFAKLLGVSPEQLETLLQQPYGLRRLLSSKIYLPVQTVAAHKSHIALELATLISDHLIKKGGSFEDVYLALSTLLKKRKAYREEEDEEIRQNNEEMLILRRVIEADMKNEQEGRVKPERLSDQERETIIKWGKRKTEKESEILYNLFIGASTAWGHTQEEVYETIHQHFINIGNLQGAELIRQFHDRSSQKPKEQGPQNPDLPS